MLWTDSNGSGAYTGEVNGLNIPDGMGSIRYTTGLVMEGMWNDGEMEEDGQDDAMGSGVGYRETKGLDAFLGKAARSRGHGSSASVM
eukprot:CCRYP_000943-RA/>CCRYP_000943-RA protein AED:0.46 eAED:0.46 QI:0/-1/0/1/-1/1/1/0/86